MKRQTIDKLSYIACNHTLFARRATADPDKIAEFVEPDISIARQPTAEEDSERSESEAEAEEQEDGGQQDEADEDEEEEGNADGDSKNEDVDEDSDNDNDYWRYCRITVVKS